MKIFVVEDDRFYNAILVKALEKVATHTVKGFLSGAAFLQQIREQPEVVTLDLGLPDMEGHELLSRIREESPHTEVIVISGQDDLKLAVQLLREGAYDYIAKDENVEERLRHCLQHIARKLALQERLNLLQDELSQRYKVKEVLVGESSGMKRVRGLIDKAVRVPRLNVSIRGAPGTGKELVARSIHAASVRSDRPFVRLRLAALPETLAEADLFGVEAGSSGSSRWGQPGKLEEADGGTLYLEDVDLLSADLQVKLLHVLQEGRVRRRGSDLERRVNVRIISASATDLSEAVKARRFRDDLYFLLLGLPIHLPALKERQKDVLLLAEYFLQCFCRDNGMEERVLSEAARHKLVRYPFPGNVRELKAVTELAAVLSGQREIGEEHLMFNGTAPVSDLLTEELTLKEYTEKIVRHYLEKYGNVLVVAEKLGVGKSTVYNMIQQWSREGEK